MKIESIRHEIHVIMEEWAKTHLIQSNSVFVIGCSTSEVAGERIGTSGSMEIAETIFSELKKLQQATQMHLAFQCCEHLNRCLVVERALALEKNWTIVSAIPKREAGGAMATYAFENMDDPVLVEKIEADAGMDIGHTLIGMHLKHVAVPIRFKQKTIGDAHVVNAFTRPKLIGGERAVYRD
ncbi:TIGR01440 family protein [Bacillaceae bacterium W0354]